jgi:aldehyde dehydrogenase family protein
MNATYKAIELSGPGKFSEVRKPLLELEKIKSLPKPLAGYVFSRNQRAIDRVLQSLSFGGGAVNQTNIFLFIESMPYGGVGTSSIGNYYGKYGYDSLARQVDPDISTGRGYRSFVSALHQRKGSSTQSMV